MNYYARYFDVENVLKTPEELVAWLAGVPGIEMDDVLADSIYSFCDEQTNTPKHFRLQNHKTFIVIKTTSNSLDEFKQRGAQGGSLPQEQKQQRSSYAEIIPGTYSVTYRFRRAVADPETGKCRYSDEDFAAEIHAESQQECYNKVVEYLQNHPDIDKRCQFPGIKGSAFNAELIIKD